MSIMTHFHSMAILAEFQNMYYFNEATYVWENETDLMIFTYLRYQQLIDLIGNPTCILHKQYTANKSEAPDGKRGGARTTADIRQGATGTS
jgi:hypothetical protein